MVLDELVISISAVSDGVDKGIKSAIEKIQAFSDTAATMLGVQLGGISQNAGDGLYSSLAARLDDALRIFAPESEQSQAAIANATDVGKKAGDGFGSAFALSMTNLINLEKSAFKNMLDAISADIDTIAARARSMAGGVAASAVYNMQNSTTVNVQGGASASPADIARAIDQQQREALIRGSVGN